MVGGGGELLRHCISFGIVKGLLKTAKGNGTIVKDIPNLPIQCLFLKLKHASKMLKCSFILLLEINYFWVEWKY